MKSFIVFFNACLLSCTLFSCNEEVVFDDANNETSVLKTKSQDEAPYYVREDGILSFASVEDYYATTDLLMNFSNKELRNWEKQNGFTSYRTYTNEIIDEIENAQNDNDEMKVTFLLSKYSKYVYMNNDSIIMPIIQANAYRCVANKDGVFYLNDTKNIVDGKYISAESNIMAKNTPIKYSYIISNDLLRDEDEYVDYDNMEYVKSDNKKSVNASCKLIRHLVSKDAQGTFCTKVQFEVTCFGRRNKKWGGWQRYSTSHTIEKIHCHFKNIPISVKPDATLGSLAVDYNFDHDGVDKIDDDSKYGVQTYDLGLMVKNYANPLTSAQCIHFMVKTAGTYPEGLGYNYYMRNYNDKDNTCSDHDYIENKTE